MQDTSIAASLMGFLKRNGWLVYSHSFLSLALQEGYDTSAANMQFSVAQNAAVASPVGIDGNDSWSSTLSNAVRYA